MEKVKEAKISRSMWRDALLAFVVNHLHTKSNSMTAVWLGDGVFFAHSPLAICLVTLTADLYADVCKQSTAMLCSEVTHASVMKITWALTQLWNSLPCPNNPATALLLIPRAICGLSFIRTRMTDILLTYICRKAPSIQGLLGAAASKEKGQEEASQALSWRREQIIDAWCLGRTASSHKCYFCWDTQ